VKIINTRHPEVLVIEPQVFGDNRGWFMEVWNLNRFSKMGIEAQFVQDNHSFTRKKGTIRGLHFQNNPMSQAKLVRCSSGVVMDIAVDLRKGSPYYLQWVAVELSAENRRVMYIPRGFAHGYITLADNVEFIYSVDNYYCKELDRSIKYNDPDIGIEWGTACPILSEKDSIAPALVDSDCNFTYLSK